MKRRGGNPYWLQRTDFKVSPHVMRGVDKADRDVLFALAGAPFYETPKDARKRRQQAQTVAKATLELEEILGRVKDAKPAKAKRGRRTAAQRFHGAGVKSSDDLLVAVAKLGGLAPDSARKLLGAELFKVAKAAKVGGIRRLIRKGGLPADDMAQALKEEGYPVGVALDDQAPPLADVLLDALHHGEPIHKREHRETAAVDDLAAELRERELAHAGDFAAGVTNPLLLSLHNPPRRRRGKARRNPAGKRAPLDAFRTFHDAEPTRIVDLGPGLPDLVALGELREIVYKPSIGARKGPAFVHKFGRGARVAATTDGKHLFLIPAKGRPYRVDWERGIIG